MAEFTTLDACREALDANPKNRSALSALALLLAAAGDEKATATTLKRIEETFPNEPLTPIIRCRIEHGAQRWDDLVRCASEGLEEFHDQPALLRFYAVGLEQCGELETALSVWRELARTATSSTNHVASACRVAHQLQDWRALDQLATSAISNHGEVQPFVDHRIEALLRLDRAEELEQIYSGREDPASLRARCRIANATSEWPDLDTLATKLLETSPSSRFGLRHKFLASSALFRFDEARATAKDLRDLHPDEPLGWIGPARIAQRTFNLTEATENWRTALNRFPTNDGVWLGLFHSLLQASAFEQATLLLREKAPPEDPSWLAVRQSELHVARYEFEEAFAVLAKYLENPATAVSREALVKATQTAMMFRDDPRPTAKALKSLRSITDPTPREIVLTAEASVISGDYQQANRVIDSLPTASSNSPGALRIRSWQAMHYGRVQESKHLADLWLATTYYPQLHNPDPTLTSIDETAGISDGDVVALVVVRDEMTRIEDFLSHHRSIGVDRFIIVDNESADGTCEFLASQDDVILYATSEDYVTAGLGMRWVNFLIDEMATSNWCLFLDADEHFIYPGFEHRDIRQLLAYLERNGHEVVRSFMLDMHAASFEDQLLYDGGSSLLEHFPFFTNSYVRQPHFVCPYETIGGGFRSKILGQGHRDLIKTPLVHSNGSVRFLTSSHQVTPAVVSDVTTALLHYKFVGDSMKRATNEASWTPHHYYSNSARQQAKSLSLLQNAGADSYLSPDAVRWSGSQQLVDLGLLTTTDSFERPAR